MQQYSVVYKSFKHKGPGGDTCGIYPLSSFINHHCVPNAQVGFVNNTIVITALTDIRDGDQLFIDYFSGLSPTSPRNPLLEAIYGFKCTCSKCLRRAIWK
jgi:SET domain-containing protein